MGISAPPQTRPSKFCAACSDIIDRMAVVCPKCGVMQPTPHGLTLGSEKRLLPTFLLAFLLGPLGAHRFYVGKPITAILMLVTLGGLGIWWLVDLVRIIIGAFSDGEGERITEWV